MTTSSLLYTTFFYNSSTDTLKISATLSLSLSFTSNVNCSYFSRVGKQKKKILILLTITMIKTKIINLTRYKLVLIYTRFKNMSLRSNKNLIGLKELNNKIDRKIDIRIGEWYQLTPSSPKQHMSIMMADPTMMMRINLFDLKC